VCVCKRVGKRGKGVDNVCKGKKSVYLLQRERKKRESVDKERKEKEEEMCVCVKEKMRERVCV